MENRLLTSKRTDLGAINSILPFRLTICRVLRELKLLTSLVTFLLLSTLAYAQDETTHFVLTITTTADDESFAFYTEDTNYDIDWDSNQTFDMTGVSGNQSHTFVSAGEHTIRFKNLHDIHINGQADATKYTSIEQWGTSTWNVAMDGAFWGANDLIMTATDTPDMRAVRNMAFMFTGATSFNGDIGGWNTAQVTDMSYMFHGASSFNGDIGRWNTAQVTNMEAMFFNAASFNRNIGRWNTAQVTDMSLMFGGYNVVTSFNQDIGRWNVEAVTNMAGMFQAATSFNQDIGNWNTAQVTNMKGIFVDATSFNQDIGRWNVEAVTTMTFMFVRATSFNQDIGRWNVEAVRFMRNMFFGGTLSIANYDSLLVGWNRQNLQKGVIFNGGASKYSSDVAHVARANMISSDNWSITDGRRVVQPNDHAPVFTSGTTVDVDVEEGSTAVTIVIATDADKGQTVTFTLTGGADEFEFSITSAGVLTFYSAPDFETPRSAAGSNVYEVIVTATDGHPSPLTATQTLTITVTDVVNEPLGLEAFTGIVIYPNPTGAVLHISGVEGNVRYTLSGMEGKIVKRGQLKVAGTADHSVAIPSLKKGIYLLQITTSEGSITKKIVKE